MCISSSDVALPVQKQREKKQRTRQKQRLDSQEEEEEKKSSVLRLSGLDLQSGLFRASSISHADQGQDELEDDQEDGQAATTQLDNLLE